MGTRKKFSLMLIVIILLQCILPILSIVFKTSFTIISKATTEWYISATEEDNVKAVYDETTKTLTISGKGEMKDWTWADWYNRNYTPWYGIREGIQKVIIEEGVTNIGSRAFMDCIDLKNIELPYSIKSINTNTFYGCNGLISIKFQEGLETIGLSSFMHCKNLNKIEIPKSVKTIDDSAFYGCSNLINIDVNENNEKFSSVNGILFNKEKTKIVKYPEGKKEKEYSIPNSVTNIGYEAFTNCASIVNISIPNKVEIIGDYAFCNCDSLMYIELPSSVTEIGNSAFMSCESLVKINIPESVNTIGKGIFSYSKLQIEVELEGTIQEIELPDIIKRAQQEGDILYTEKDFTLTNCSLSEDKTKLIVDTEKLEKEIVSLKINDGALAGLTVLFVPKIIIDMPYEQIDSYIKNVKPETTIKSFLSNIKTNASGIEFYKNGIKVTDENALIATGMTLKLSLHNEVLEYTLVVTGDLDGDGKLGNIDLLKLVRYQVGLDTTVTGAYLEATDINKNNTYADGIDILKMARILVGLDSL